MGLLGPKSPHLMAELGGTKRGGLCPVSRAVVVAPHSNQSSLQSAEVLVPPASSSLGKLPLGQAGGENGAAQLLPRHCPPSGGCLAQPLPCHLQLWSISPPRSACSCCGAWPPCPGTGRRCSTRTSSGPASSGTTRPWTTCWATSAPKPWTQLPVSPEKVTWVPRSLPSCSVSGAGGFPRSTAQLRWDVGNSHFNYRQAAVSL